MSKLIKVSTLNTCGVERFSNSTASPFQQPTFLFCVEGVRELTVGVRSMTCVRPARGPDCSQQGGQRSGLQVS